MAPTCLCRATSCDPLDVAVATGAGCYMVVSERSMARSEVRAFVDWLLAKPAKFNAELDGWLKRSGAVPGTAVVTAVSPSPGGAARRFAVRAGNSALCRSGCGQ